MILRRLLLLLGAAVLAIGPAGPSIADEEHDPGALFRTATPIKHVVVIYQENVSFDHYFGTYPNAANPAGEPVFRAKPGTPAVNGLLGTLLSNNPNLSNPQRLDRAQAHTCDQDHGYTNEQKAVDLGAMDKAVEFTGHQLTVAQCTGIANGVDPNFAVMDYYDGNTVTALWNYAQRFAMSDNSFSTTFGPSSPGALNLITGNNFGAICGPAGSTINDAACPSTFSTANQPGVPAAQGTGSVVGDPQPFFENCNTRGSASLGGQNVGDLLNAKGVTWGWFAGGFDACKTAAHTSIGNTSPILDYIPHHMPFQFFQSTSNPSHLPPTSDATVGQQDQANHQYDLGRFFTAADQNRLPAVSFLKAQAFQDGHAGYSNPLDEQTFLVDTINHLQRLPSWRSTAVVIAYDDSDGWYDHVVSPLVQQSQTAIDALTGTGQCGANPARVPSGQQGRCGFGPRQPLLVISPFSRGNFVDGTLTDQSSITRLIEDNWALGRVGSGSADARAGSLMSMFDFQRPNAERFILDPSTGRPTGQGENG
jgi:phospholipase C